MNKISKINPFYRSSPIVVFKSRFQINSDLKIAMKKNKRR